MSFISEYKPRLTYLTNCGSSDNPAWSTHSTLEILVQIDDSTETPTHGVSLFDKMRTLDSDVDVKDHLGRTLLNQFVMNLGYRHRWVVERLIKAGAEVDNLYQVRWVMDFYVGLRFATIVACNITKCYLVLKYSERKYEST